MSSRDRRLAQTKYAGKKSASEKAAEKSRAKTAEDPMTVMRRVIAEPRSEESVQRARRHNRSLPPLG
jgi:hypothetical protein